MPRITENDGLSLKTDKSCKWTQINNFLLTMVYFSTVQIVIICCIQAVQILQIVGTLFHFD